MNLVNYPIFESPIVLFETEQWYLENADYFRDDLEHGISPSNIFHPSSPAYKQQEAIGNVFVPTLPTKKAEPIEY